MSRNLVVCCDGTGNQFGTNNTNVLKLYSTLARDPDRQLLFYDAGVGTMGAPHAIWKVERFLTKVAGLAFGYGLTGNVIDAYRFLMRNWQPGDQIYLFGFSRGAYTARVLAGMLHMMGLLHPEEENLCSYALRLFRERAFGVSREFQKVMGRPVGKVRFIGVWDTVSSVGWFPVTFPYTARTDSFITGRHAISIDERRAFFRTNRWNARPEDDVKQVWFAGVHCDVGGGYKPEQAGLSQIALEWMVDEAAANGLIFDMDRVRAVLGEKGPEVRPDHKAAIHDPYKDHGFWRVLEFVPKQHVDMSADPPKQGWKIYFFSRRQIREGETLHQSVIDRTQTPGLKYAPKLPKTYNIEPWGGSQTRTAAT